jgi:hypothetical protein
LCAVSSSFYHVLQYVENNVAVFLLDEIFIKVKEKYDMVMLMVSDLWQENFIYNSG